MASWLSQSQYDMLTDLANTNQDMGELTKNIIHIHLDQFIHIDDIEDMYEDGILPLNRNATFFPSIAGAVCC